MAILMKALSQRTTPGPTATKTLEKELHHRNSTGSNSSDSTFCSSSSLFETSFNNGGSFHKVTKSCLKIKSQQESLTNSYGNNTNNNNTSNNTSNNKIEFTTIEFREYQRILTNNPSTSGPPIGLGWHHYPEYTAVYPLRAYDDHATRRLKFQLRIPSSVRFEMLQEEGYRRNDIDEVMKVCRKDRERRAASARSSRRRGITVMEGVKSKFGSVKKFMRRNKNGKEVLEEEDDDVLYGNEEEDDDNIVYEDDEYSEEDEHDVSHQ